MADKTPVRYFPAGEVGAVDQLGEYQPSDTIAWSFINKVGSSLADLATRSASDLVSGTLPSGRLAGSYTGITGVGTIVSGTWNGSSISTTYTDAKVVSVAGTLNRITSSGTNPATVDISASYVGQASITTLGTIVSGTWQGTAVDATHGGTAQTSWATGDLLYGSGVNTLAKRAVGSTGDVLTVAGGVPTWAAPSTGLTITGTANRITTAGSSPTVIDIAATYVGQASITTLGTIVTGVWNGSSIGTAYTDAKVVSVAGTANRITASGTNPATVDISAAYVGQSSITTVGTLSTGAVPASLVTTGTFGAGAYTFPSTLIVTSTLDASVVRAGGTVAGSSSQLHMVGSGVAGNVLKDTAAGVDGKIWDMFVSGTLMKFRTVNDAFSSSVTWLQTTRSGTTVSAIDLTATAVNVNGGELVTGGLSVGTSAIPGTGIVRVANSASQGILQMGGSTTGNPQVNYDQNGTVKAYTFFDNATQRLTLNRSGASGGGVTVDSSDDTWLSGNVIGVGGKAIYTTSISTANLRYYWDTNTAVVRGGTSGIIFQSSTAAQLGGMANAGYYHLGATGDARIGIADGLSAATDSRFLFSNSTGTHAALRWMFNNTTSVAFDAIQQNNTAVTKSLLINVNGGVVGVGPGGFQLLNNNSNIYGTKATATVGNTLSLLRLNANDDLEVFGDTAATGKLLKLAHSEANLATGYVGLGNDVWLKGGSFIISNSGTVGRKVIRYDGTNNSVQLSDSAQTAQLVEFMTGQTALGATTLITLGKTGGSGPATAAQNSWLKIKAGGGNSYFIPLWV